MSTVVQTPAITLADMNSAFSAAVAATPKPPQGNKNQWLEAEIENYLEEKGYNLQQE